MRIVAIDSSGLVASVAILENDSILATYSVNYKKTHSQTLLPMLQEIMQMTEFDKTTIDAIAVAKGPGSFTGLRIGEVCGLKWEDIDLDDGVIRVRRTVQTNYVYEPDGTGRNKLSIGSPKSRTSRRDVPICAPLRARLERLDRPADVTAYFLTGTQSPTVPRTFRSSVDLFLSRHGIEKFNFHRLRHTFATRCIEAGVDAKTTSELLGHANVNITLNLYVHPNAEAKREAVDRMAEAFALPKEVAR